MKPSKKQTNKLIAGRRLSKGDNLTNTTFKTRKIQIHNQEKQYSGKPGDKKKFNVLELLKSFPHCNNKSVKLKKLSKISEFVSSASDSDSYELNEIFSSVIQLILDVEAKLRNQALKIMKHMFEKFPNAESYPHFSNIRNYIGCAMTNINAGIRHDSLQLLILTLYFFPNTICKRHALLNTILGLISHPPKTNITVGAHSHLLPIVAPEAQLSTLKGRNSVLKCISTFLLTNVSRLKPKNEGKPMSNWDMKSRYHLQQFHSSPSYPDSYEDEIILSGRWSEIDFNNNKTAFENFINYLIPVLFEIWIEVTSSDSFGSMGHNECLKTRTVTLDIICLLVEWINYTESKTYLEGILCRAYNEKIRRKFFQNFPYSDRGSSYVNDRLCQIYCDIIVKGPHSPNLNQQVSGFLLNSIKRDFKAEELARIVQLLKNMLEYKDIMYLYEEHLDALYFSIGHLKDQHCRKIILNFFLDLMPVLPKLTERDENHILIKVLKLIPMEFIKASTDYIEDTHSEFFRNILRITGCWKFGIQQGVSEHFHEIADLLASKYAFVRRVAVGLIGKSPFISKQQFVDIALVIRQEDVPEEDVEHLFYELTSRIDAVDPLFQRRDFLIFSLNLRFGQALCKDAVPMPFNKLEHCIPYKLSSYTIVEDDFPLTKDFTDIISKSLNHFPERKEVYEFVQQYLSYVLGKLHTVSFHVALSVLKFAKEVMHTITVPKMFWIQVADLNVGCFLHAIALSTQFASQNTGGTDPTYDMYIKLLNCTFNIGYLYIILAWNSEAIKNTDYIYHVEQLILQIFNAPVGELKSEDYKYIAIFFLTLKRRFGDYFSKKAWFNKVCLKASHYQ